MFPVWTPRDNASFADDEWSDHHPSPINPMYSDPVDAWLSPATVADDVDMLFDYSQSNSFLNLLDDSASRREQQKMLQLWRTGSKSTSKSNALSRQPTLDDVVIASEWEEKITRRYQRKHGLQSLSLREVKRKMPPIEFDPVFADSDTEDDEEPPFNPESLADPPMRRLPSPIAIPPGASCQLSPLTPLTAHVSVSPPPTPALVPAASAQSPVIKQEPIDDVLRASPAVKRPHSPELEQGPDDVVSEGEYVPSDDEEDDADPTYGAPKARRASHTALHSRASPDKPARPGPGRRRRPVDDTAPSQCTYESPINGHRCQQIFARLPEMKRHIDHFHHEQEARAVIEGRLSRDQASLLGDTWDGTLGKPTCEGCGTEFSRRDAVKRHQNEVKAKFEDGHCVWCPGTQGRKGSAKRVAAAKLAAGTPVKKQRRK